MNFTLREQLSAAFFAAIIAVLSPLTIPFGLIPLTLQTFAVGLTVTVLGARIGTASILLYLLLGLIGLPVFAGGSAGVGVLFGPTGGFLIGFIFNGLITGWIVEKAPTYFWGIIGNILGAMATLLFGMIWLKIGGGMSWLSAFNAGILPFILPGIIKALAAGVIGILLRHRLSSYLIGLSR